MVGRVIIAPSTPPTAFVRNNPLWISVRPPRAGQIRRNHRSSYGVRTPAPEHHAEAPAAKCPFVFQTGYALCAKRSPRPFPPPFTALPTTSFSDPLTSPRGQDRRLSIQGEPIRGLTNGDDAVLVGENFMGVNDGVGAWATKPKGHAG